VWQRKRIDPVCVLGVTDSCEGCQHVNVSHARFNSTWLWIWLWMRMWTVNVNVDATLPNAKIAKV